MHFHRANRVYACSPVVLAMAPSLSHVLRPDLSRSKGYRTLDLFITVGMPPRAAIAIYCNIVHWSTCTLVKVPKMQNARSDSLERRKPRTSPSKTLSHHAHILEKFCKIVHPCVPKNPVYGW